MSYERDTLELGGEPLEQKIQRREAFREKYHISVPFYWVTPEDANVVFIVSSGKCGTTTMDGVLNLSEDIVSYHEPQPRLWHLEREVLDNECHSRQNDKIFWSARRDIISSVNAHDYIYVECNHRVSVFMPSMMRLFKNAKFIWLLRDMDSCVRSMLRWGKYTESDINLTGRPSPRQDEFEHIKDRGTLLAWYWCRINQHIQKHFVKLPQSRKLFFPFEHIKNKDINEFNKLYDWLEAERPPEEQITEYLSKPRASTDHNIKIDKTWDYFNREAERIGHEI